MNQNHYVYYFLFLKLVGNWNEFDIFYRLPSYNIVTNIPTPSILKLICPLNITMLKSGYNISFNYIWCDLLYETIERSYYFKFIKKYIDLKGHVSKMINIYQIYYLIFSNFLIVNKKVNDIVKNYLYKNKIFSYVSLQIRLGNEDLKEHRMSNFSDIKEMIEIAKKCKYKKWYVTGDSIRKKLYLKCLYKQIFLYSTDYTRHYKNNRKNYTIVVEHEILSRSKVMIISPSTYGLTALLKSGLLLSSKDLSYVVKGGKAYNMKNEFSSFHQK